MSLFQRRRFFRPRTGQVYIVPTRYGFIYGFMVVVLLFIAAVYANNLVYLLTFLTLVLGLLSMVQTNNNLKALEVVALPQQPLPAEGTNEWHVTVFNPSKEPKLMVDIFWETSQQHQADGTLEWLGPRETTKVSLQVKTQKPGVSQIERLRLRSVHPMGLFRAWRWQPVEHSLYVYPVPEGHQDLRPSSSHSASHGVSPARGSDDFHDHEKYQPGHSFRHIDWRVYSRSDGFKADSLMSKRFLQESGKNFQLDWNLIEAVSAEARLKQMSRWLQQLEGLPESYSFRLPGRSASIGQGENFRRQCLRELAAMSSSSPPKEEVET